MGAKSDAGLGLSTPQPRRTKSSVLLKALAAISLWAILATVLPIKPFFSIKVYRNISLNVTVASDPADEWQDNVYPLRPQTPWDISTDFPYPRKLEYDVTEGTWMRLDVHPRTGDIVFDMLGDIYCLPASAYSGASSTETRAIPVLLGVPHDTDPHLSPDGGRLVFISDAGLGLQNAWVMPWTSCADMDVRPYRPHPALLQALNSQEEDEDLLAHGRRETLSSTQRRLLREGRHSAVRVTNETYRWVTDARFHPSGRQVVATKWYTSERSIGAGEGWTYDVPYFGSGAAREIAAGSGARILGRALPTGWSAAQYGDQQVGPEQFVWRGDDAVIYAKNVIDVDGTFQYSKNVHAGIYSIFSRNLTTNRTETLVPAFPGGASRPELSRDGRTLAFVRRANDKEVLALKDLVTGSLTYAYSELTYDASPIYAPMGTYPSFAFTPDDSAVVIWAAGQLRYIPLAVNARGEREAHPDDAARTIPFRAHVELRLAETLHSSTDVVALETAETQRVHAFRQLSVDTTGARAVFEAAGKTYLLDVESKETKALPVLDEDAPYYAPSFVAGSEDLVVHQRWSDTNFTSLEIANVATGEAYAVGGLPFGRYFAPTVSPCAAADGTRAIAYVRTLGDVLSGEIVATGGAGLYVGKIDLSAAALQKKGEIEVVGARLLPSSVPTYSHLTVRFGNCSTGADLLFVDTPSSASVIDLGSAADVYGEYAATVVARGRTSTEVALAPGGASAAFVDWKHVYVAPASGKNSKGAPLELWSKPGNATEGVARVSLDGGHQLAWSGDGKKLFWFLGPYLHYLEASKLEQCASAIRKDGSTFGIDCTKGLLDYQEVVVTHSTDIARLKREAAVDVLIVKNATILTMGSGYAPEADLVRGSLVVRGGVIEHVLSGNMAGPTPPDGAHVVDAEGGYVIPGFVDMHAHWGSAFGALHPARSWEHETFLAYGVTTLHNPSADTVYTYNERGRIERGQMVGPRVFQTGSIIYGAAGAGVHHSIVDMDDARSALLRIKVEGGPASFSYKNYQLPIRAQRQRLLLAARKLGMVCVPEGGMNIDWDTTYIVDGMTTVEHNLPIPVLYEDMLTLFAMSGTASVPTHIVNYGGPMGEQLVWATEGIPNDPKLRHFVRHDSLARVAESTARPKNSYALFNVSTSVAKMVHRGLKAHIGAHGEAPLGLNYHAEMYFAKQGGLTNFEVIRAATSDAAETLGIHGSIGSLVPGKLADMLIYPPGLDLLKDDIRSTRDIRFVIRGGRLYEADTLREAWPVKGRRPQMSPVNAD